MQCRQGPSSPGFGAGVRSPRIAKNRLQIGFLPAYHAPIKPTERVIVTVPARPAIPVPLGDLEIQVLEYLWAQPEGSTAKQAHKAVGEARGVTLNTVQSALERLFRKELLSRHKQSHAYFYCAAVSRQTFLSSLINQVLGRFGGDSASSVAAMVDVAESLDSETLELLEQAIRDRRQQESGS